MEKLSLKIQRNYVVYGILFYAISIINYKRLEPDSSDFASGLSNVIEIAIFWCVTNMFFLLTLVVTSLIGMIYSKIKRRETLKSFRLIFIVSSILLSSMLILC